MTDILIITLVALVAFLLLTGCGIMRDFSRLWLKHSVKVFGCKQGIGYYKELAVTMTIVLVLAITALIVKGAITTLVAMATTDDVAQFTTALRGTYSAYTTELQSPKNHILLFLLNPAIKILSIVTLLEGIKLFFIHINKKAGGECYDEADVLYFSSIGVLFIIAIEILCHTQDVNFANMTGNIALLLLDKTAYIIILLTLEEIMMLRANKNGLERIIEKYLITTDKEKRTILSGWKQLILTYILCLSIAMPYYLGFQWIRDDSTLLAVFIFILCAALLFMKIVFRDAWNLMGTVMFANVHLMALDNTPLCSKLRHPVIVGLFAMGVLLVAFGIYYPKQLFMLIMIMAFTACFIVFFIVVIYFLTMGIGYLVSVISRNNTNSSSIQNCIVYISWVIGSLSKAVIAPVSVVILAFMTMTCFPKPLKCDSLFIKNSVVDTDGNYLYIDEDVDEEHNQQYYIPVLYNELPEFFKKILVAQEDRGFFQQGNFLPKSPSNWHGISLSVFRGRGGSNLNAQICKNYTFIDAEGFPRDLSRKLCEVVSGYMISQKESPEHIMELYVNVAGFHGTIAGARGVNAASLFAFGKPVGQLNLIQQLYLVNTLPRGKYVKGTNEYIAYKDIQNDSNDLVKKALINKAQRWRDEGLISKKEFNTLKRQELGFTNCRYKSNIPISTRSRFKKHLGSSDRHLCYITLKNEQAMTRAYNTLRNCDIFSKNGAELEVASIVVNVDDGHILAHFSSGMIDYVNYREGFEIGSLGKAPIVTEMLQMGASHNFTLYDGQMDKRKTPKNANHGWSNRYVTISEALSLSLNAPFVNISPILNPQSVFINTENSYRKMGIRSDSLHKKMCEDTYNYPLGIRQMFVTEVAQMYQTIINDGVCCPLREFETGDVKESIRIYDSKNVAVVKQALSHTIVDGTMKDLRTKLPDNRTFYAKTGTTTRQRYGWAVLSDGNILIVTFASYGRHQGDNMKLGVEPLWGASTAGQMSTFVYNEINKQR